MRGLDHLSCEEGLWNLDLFSPEKTEGDLINGYKYHKGGCPENGVRLWQCTATGRGTMAIN